MAKTNSYLKVGSPEIRVGLDASSKKPKKMLNVSMPKQKKVIVPKPKKRK
jgi:hypothetical protein